MRPIIIDVEASGLGRGSYPIEVGIANGSGETHCMLIKPLAEWQHWDHSAELMHGITRDILASYGHPVAEVARKLNALLGGETVYSDAWGNDSSWISQLFDAAEMSQHFRVQSLRDLLSEIQIESWHETKQHIVEENGMSRHRASADALLLQQTYCQTLGKNSPLAT